MSVRHQANILGYPRTRLMRCHVDVIMTVVVLRLAEPRGWLQTDA
jgi:hypothetical protein